MAVNSDQGKRLRQVFLTRFSRIPSIRWPSRLHLFALFVFLFVTYNLTPYDSPIRSFFRFTHDALAGYIESKHPNDEWLYRQQLYPVDPVKDIGVIIKTGYGTKQRVPPVLAAWGNESFTSDILVVQDYPVSTSKNYTLPNGKLVPAVDIIGWMLENKHLEGQGGHERVMKYKHMAMAVEAGEEFLADELSKSVGWELDAMKFISAFQYAWEYMPKKKWYIMADDDTYVIKSSLSLLLGHLDWKKPQYLGNAVGDYKGRFAHGGSSAIVSGAAMRDLFETCPEIAEEAHRESTTETFGDKLLATTFMKLGVYINEAYSRLFNGEPPLMTRIWADRFCIPLVSFHGLGSNDDMQDVGTTFRDMKEPVFWRQLGRIYGAASFESYMFEPMRANQDFIGRLDERSTSVSDVESVAECFNICHDHSADCLAWAYDEEAKQCHYAPWTIIGNFREHYVSGINAPLAMQLESHCHTPRLPVAASE